jgi:hypothetical protein
MKLILLCICSFLLFGFASVQNKPADKGEILKINLLKATIKAIDFEMERFKDNPEKIKYFSQEVAN